MKQACKQHDQANLWCLPLLGGLAVLGLCGLVDPVKVTIAFTWCVSTAAACAHQFVQTGRAGRASAQWCPPGCSTAGPLVG